MPFQDRENTFVVIVEPDRLKIEREREAYAESFGNFYEFSERVDITRG